MRLTEYGRNPHTRKAYVQQPNLLMVGVDVSKAKHYACLGTQTSISRRKLEFTHTREGIERFEQTLKQQLVKNACRHVLIAMEPSGISWQALYDRLQRGGYGVCLVHCQAVRNNRKTMQEGTSKTDEKDAYSVFDLLRQGKFFLPVERDPELQAAYRLMQRSMALKKRVSQLRNQLRAAIHLAFPELNPLVKDLTQPTALRFLQANPTPESILRHGRTAFWNSGSPAIVAGSGVRRTSTASMTWPQPASVSGPLSHRRVRDTTLADDLVDALTKQQLWLDKAIELLAPRADYQLLLQLPRIGKPTAAAILTAIGDMHEYQTANNSSNWLASISVYSKAARVSENSPKSRTWAVPTSDTGSITMPCGSSRMSRISKPTISDASTNLPGKEQDNGLSSPSVTKSSA